MARTLVIRCDPQRLAPTYSDDCTDFTLSMTTAVDNTGAVAADARVPLACLAPWRWKDASRLVFWSLPAAGPAAAVAAAPIAYVPPLPGPVPANWNAFIAALEGPIPDPANAGSDAYFAYKPALDGHPNDYFAIHLATLQSLGTSTPQWLNLVRFVRVQSAGIPATPVAVLPVITVAGAAGDVVLTPDIATAVITVTPQRATNVTFSYTAAPAAGLPFAVRGEAQIDAPPLDDPTALIDPVNLIVRAGSDDNYRLFGEDWMAALSSRVAEGIDLPSHVIAWAQLLLTLKPAPGAPVAADPTLGSLYKVRRAFLAACRTVAHAGARAEAGQATPGSLDDPASLADDLIAGLDTPPIAGDRLQIVRNIRAQDAVADAGYFANIATWQARLLQALQLSGAVPVPMPGEPGNRPPVLIGALSLAPAENATTRLTQSQIDQEIAGLIAVNTALWDSGTLAAIVTSQWNIAPPLTGPMAASASGKAKLRDRGVRRQLSLGSFGPTCWAALFAASPGATTDVAAICNNFVTLAAAYANTALAAFGASDPDLTAFISLRATAFASLGSGANPTVRKNSLLGFDPGRATNPEYGDTTPTPRSGGLVFAFDRLSPLLGKDDYLNRLAGVVIFLKQGNANAAGKTLDALRQPANLGTAFGEWRALNIADLSITYDPDGSKIVERGVLPATHFETGGGVRHPLVTYDAHPLIAQSPAAGLSGELVAAPSTPSDPISAQYNVATQQGIGWASLPELRFGQVYCLQAFAQTHAGALPNQIVTRNSHPAYVKPWSAGVDIGTVASGGNVLARVARYLRRVGVGAAVWRSDRPAPPNAPVPAPTLPAFPKTLAPLAPELPAWSDDQRGVKFDLPLILLQPGWNSPSPRSFSFDLVMPSTDFLTWDRWVATDGVRGDSAAVATKRRSVMTEYHSALAANRQSNAPDHQIDDPAVTGLHISLIDRTPPDFPRPAPGFPLELTIPAAQLPPYVGDSGLASTRRTPIHVSVKVADGWGIKPYDAAGQSLEILVPEGRVVEVNVVTLVRAAEFFTDATAIPPARLMAFGDFGYAPLATDTSFIACSKMRFAVEVATNHLPSPSDLRTALSVSLQGETIRAVLQSPATATFAYCQWADLVRQQWRWDGRDQPAFPWPPGSDLAFDPELPEKGIGYDAMAKWEVRGFGEHSDTDSFQKRSRMVFGRQPVLFEEDLRGDLRASYHRFAVRAVSRYADIMPPEFAREVSSMKALGADKVPPWRRLAVRSRWDRPLGRPKLRCLLPLTSSGAASDLGTTCLLAVFDEEWFALAGLAERLGIEIVQAPPVAGIPDGLLPVAGTASSLPLQEIGNDPIVNANKWNQSDTVSFQTSGAIGFTYDTDTDAPNFGVTSFLLSSSQPLDPWTMVKLQFRREIEKNAGNAIPADETSWTAGHWVQILPDAGRFMCRRSDAPQSTPIATSELKITVAGSASDLQFRFVDGSGLPVTLMPTQPEAAIPAAAPFVQFELWLVVTMSIQATGFEGDGHPLAPEAYVRTIRLDGATATLADLAAQLAGKALFVRIVEVQRHIASPAAAASAPSADPLWSEDIFPADQDGVAKERSARVVRVSDPIGTNGPRWPITGAIEAKSRRQ
jgi:hypothetical protein